MSELWLPEEYRKAGEFRRLGTHGVAVYGGYIVENEKDASLAGTHKYITYGDILANVSIVASAVRFFLNIISKPAWKWQPADGSPEAQRYAEQMERILGEMERPWKRVVKRMALFRFYGFSIQEWTAKRLDDGVIGYYDIEPRAQRTIERWEVDERHGDVLGVWQRSPQTQLEHFLPRQKIVYIVDDSLNDSPEGIGLLRHIVATAKQLRRYEQLEGMGFETDLRGIPIGRGPFTQLNKMVESGAISEQQRSDLEAPLRDFIENHIRQPDLGLLLDSMTYQTTDEKRSPSNVYQWDVGLLQSQPHGQKEIAEAIERKNREIARVLGVEHMLLGSTSSGSFALSSDKTQSFGQIVDATINDQADVVDKDVVLPIARLNGWDLSKRPRAQVDKVQYRDIETVTNALRDLAQSGAMLSPEDPAINEIRNLLGLSDAVPVELDLQLGMPSERPMEQAQDEDRTTDPGDD